MSKRIQDQFELGEAIGKGSYSVVKVGKELSSGKKYAIKIMKKKLFTRPEFMEREIAIMKQVDHPHIIRWYDMFEDEEKIYLVLELINGGDLFDKISERETFSEEDASDIVRQLLGALSYLHKEGIVHRDIKIDNILCEELPDKRLHTYIADFGLSRFFSNEMQMKSRVGSLDYTAPEVFLNKGYGPSCDLWSVGVVTYILLTGTFPFSDRNPKVTYERISNVWYDWEDCPPVSDDVKDFCAKLFKKDPEERLTADQALEHPWIQSESNKMHRSSSFQKLLAMASARKEKIQSC